MPATNTNNTQLKVGDLVRCIDNAKGTVWESGIIECIKGDTAYLLYGATKPGQWHGLRGMCTGEPIDRLERT